jgi:YVTN family beta-propeller protein
VAEDSSEPGSVPPSPTGDTPAGPSGDGAEIRTFLIADVRGYTLFTHERGDEAAAKLAAKFASLAREGVQARGGSVIELRGDEALAVFASPRQALRAAVELQARLVEETLADPALPLGVGIGLDAGEAVAVEGGYRGGALNLAARLCGLAGPGEVLASQEVVHLARRVERISYVDRGLVHLKGLAEPVRVIRVVPEGEDPAQLLAARPAAPSARPRGRGLRALPARLGWSGWRLAAVGLAVVVLATTAVVAVRSAGRGSRVAAIDADSLGLIDTTSDGLVGQVPLGVRSGPVAVGEGAVWVANAEAGTVTRVDPAARRVLQRISVGRQPAGVVAGGGAVWVANSGERSVSWINPTTNTEVKRIQVGNGPTGIAVGHGAVWVANSLDNSVSRIDPDKGEVVGTVPVGGTPSGVAVGLGAVWVANASDGTVARISPTRQPVVRSIPVGNGPRAIAVHQDGVWVANSLDGTISRIDPASDAVVTTVRVGDAPSAVAVGRGGVWAASEARGTVSRVDPDTSSVVRTIQVGSAPAGVVVVGDGLWVTTRGAPSSHRGGTLRLVSNSDVYITSIDPTDDTYSLSQAQILLMTNDGLVGFKRVGGVEGSELIANLATSLPRPTNGGTSYPFRLRPDIRYSTGQVVKPEDVRASIERGFKLRSRITRDYFRGVVGAEACTSQPKACDLAEGIVTDPAANTVTFRLSRPDPEFLLKLAQPTAFVVPAGTPASDVGTSPVPATGPYMIQTFVPKKSLVLVRNPRFREWSRAAQPDGYPDRIEWNPSGRGSSPIEANMAVDAVLAGRADYFGLGGDQPAGDRVEELTTRYASQTHRYPYQGQFAMYLNTRVPPFDDPRVRRAISYAVDRRAVQKLYPGLAQITCQYVPLGVIG